MKRLMLFLFMLGMLFSIQHAYAAAGDVWLVPKPPGIALGADFSLEVHADSGAEKIAGFSFTIKYDTNSIQLKGVVDESVLGGEDALPSMDQNEAVPGTIYVTGTGSNGVGPDSDLHLVTIRFTAKGVEGPTEISVTVSDLINLDIDDIGTPGRLGTPANLVIGQILTVVPAGSGTGIVTSAPLGIDCGTDCDQAYNTGTVVTLTPVATANSVFDGWSGDCAADGTVTMDSAKTCGAKFELAHELKINKTGTGSGKITSNPSGIDCGLDCTGAYQQDTLVTLVATPDTGSAFGAWTGDCAANGTVVMSSDKTCNAKFDLSPATVSLTTNTLNFGDQMKDTTSTAKTVTLSNRGNAALAITSIAATGDFALTNNNTCGNSVAATADCTISVTFTPTALGARAGAVTITTDAASSPDTVALSGNGVSAAPGVSTPVPTLSENLTILMGLMLLAIGFISLRQRNIS